MDVSVTKVKPEVRKGSAFPLSQIGKGDATLRTGDREPSLELKGEFTGKAEPFCASDGKAG